jgi:hypothetical protein
MNPFVVTQLAGERRKETSRRAAERPHAEHLSDLPVDAPFVTDPHGGPEKPQAVEGVWLVDETRAHRRRLVMAFGDLLVRAGTRLGGEQPPRLSVER